MPQEDPKNQPEEDAEDALLKRFPTLPDRPHDPPPAPKIQVNLPPHPDKPRPGAPEPGSYRGTALAMQAASSFFMPILVLGIIGWLIDKRYHTHGWPIVIGFVLGFIVGISSLLRVINQMNEDPPKRQ